MKACWALVAFFAMFIVTTHGVTAESPAPHIQWDQKTLTLVAAQGNYARMIRLKNGNILCCYSRGGKVCLRGSIDNGKKWGGEITVASCNYGAATNAEIVQLSDGRVLYAYNVRPSDGVHRFAINTCFSSDNGKTWTKPRQVFAAGKTFENGCWEPAAIQLPSGEIQLFFANEAPYRKSNEQEITMIRSLDGGATWGKPERICFRKGRRDGMPVPLILKNGKGVVLAIEDPGARGRFKPATIITSMKDNWRQGLANGKSPRRRASLLTPLPPGVYAGAPYICQLDSGVTILSVQSTEGRKVPRGAKQTLSSRMVVYVGNGMAEKFTNRSEPFIVDKGSCGVWNSVFAKGPKTVTAVSSATIGGVRGIWAIDGKLVDGSARTRDAQ
ncbi:MAG: exo-alpha-sialidase [Phycisphaerales bacterium]|jgi:hypothetical protein|nr:exo-alpha-sialidase [Phycisphaerales bacterium]